MESDGDLSSAETMKKWWIFLAFPFLIGATPISDTHTSFDEVDQELRNIYLSMQANQFTVLTTTPVPTDLKDNEIVIYSSGTVKQLIWRDGVDIYSVQGSCITVRR